MEGIIAVNLKKSYELKEKKGFFHKRIKKTVDAVKGISITVPKGKIIGLLGINGAGKTTTIRMLSSIIEPTSGTINIDGLDAIKYHFNVKEKINVISGGERNLYWRLTAVENLKYFGSLYGLSGKNLEERVEQLLEIVDLDKDKNTPVERYSKGMKQRLQIARGLINNPEYLFLDEPTLGLDVIIAKEIRQFIVNLAMKDKKGILLTTHYISEAEELCDYIYVIDNGIIIAEGTKEDLKGLFEYKQELAIYTKEYDCLNRQELKELSNRYGCNIIFDNIARHIRVIGDSNIWTEVLNMLTMHGCTITSLKLNEPRLEEILVYLIENYRKNVEE